MWTRSYWHLFFPCCRRLVSEARLMSSGRAVPQPHQRVANGPAELLDGLVGEDRFRVCEPVDAAIHGGQRLLQLLDVGLKDRVFSCLDLTKGVAERADFR